jgi:hypothetical protein
MSGGKQPHQVLEEIARADRATSSSSSTPVAADVTRMIEIQEQRRELEQERKAAAYRKNPDWIPTPQSSQEHVLPPSTPDILERQQRLAAGVRRARKTNLRRQGFDPDVFAEYARVYGFSSSSPPPGGGGSQRSRPEEARFDPADEYFEHIRAGDRPDPNRKRILDFPDIREGPGKRVNYRSLKETMETRRTFDKLVSGSSKEAGIIVNPGAPMYIVPFFARRTPDTHRC